MQSNPIRDNIRIIIALAIAVVVVLVGYAIYTTANQSGKIPVKVSVIPKDARVTLNGVEVGSGETYLKPGGYEIKASKDGFTEVTQTKEITEANNTIALSLAPESDEATKWAEENQDQYLENEELGGIEAQQKGEDFRTKNPIVNLLPNDSLLYTIGYRADPADPSGDSIIIEIDADEPYRQQAIYQISQWGYDPTDFNIKFRNYKNPFAS